MAEVVQNETCPECGARFDFSQDKNATRVYGRVYRWRHALNRVLKCAHCGYVFSWKEDT